MATIENEKLQPMILFNHIGMHMPNGWKINILMKEFGIKYDTKWLDFNKEEQKQSPHIDYNPNGRIPTLVDPNNGNFPVWESNAIMLYLMQRYDPENKTGFLGRTPEEKSQVTTWLFFQASGQGPYYGQAHWFMYLHQEEVPSAITRYQNEVMRVLGVMEGHLKDREWMVGDNVTLADLSLLAYNAIYAPRLLPEGVTIEERYPAVAAWQKRLIARKSVYEHLKEREIYMKQYAHTIPAFKDERSRMEPVLSLVDVGA